MIKDKDIEYFNQLAKQAATDDDAFTKFYEHYFPIVYNLLYSRIKNSTTTDDVTSDVFLKVLQNLKGFDESKAASSTWIATIMRRVFVDYLRNLKRREYVEWDDYFSPPAPENEQPEMKVLKAENKSELLKALGKLNKREQRIIELKYYADMSNKEIAETLSTSVGNVGIILFRALGKLRKELEKNYKD